MKIKINEGKVERYVRIVTGGILILLINYLALPALLHWSLLIIGIILVLTGLSGYCLIYDLLKISTK